MMYACCLHTDWQYDWADGFVRRSFNVVQLIATIQASYSTSVPDFGDLYSLVKNRW